MDMKIHLLGPQFVHVWNEKFEEDNLWDSDYVISYSFIKLKKNGGSCLFVSCVYIGVLELDIVTKGHLLTPFLPVSKYEPKSSFDVQD